MLLLLEVGDSAEQMLSPDNSSPHSFFGAASGPNVCRTWAKGMRPKKTGQDRQNQAPPPKQGRRRCPRNLGLTVPAFRPHASFYFVTAVLPTFQVHFSPKKEEVFVRCREHLINKHLQPIVCFPRYCVRLCTHHSGAPVGHSTSPATMRRHFFSKFRNSPSFGSAAISSTTPPTCLSTTTTATPVWGSCFLATSTLGRQAAALSYNLDNRVFREKW